MTDRIELAKSSIIYHIMKTDTKNSRCPIEAVEMRSVWVCIVRIHSINDNSCGFLPYRNVVFGVVFMYLNFVFQTFGLIVTTFTNVCMSKRLYDYFSWNNRFVWSFDICWFLKLEKVFRIKQNCLLKREKNNQERETKSHSTLNSN